MLQQTAAFICFDKMKYVKIDEDIFWENGINELKKEFVKNEEEIFINSYGKSLEKISAMIIFQTFIEMGVKENCEYTSREFAELLNVNDFVSDKIKEDSVDIVIAVGVLNNAKNIEVTLKNIKKVLKKDGKVIIVEAIGESVQMLISQAFMMQEPDDARAEKNETFLKLYQWHELFQKVGFAVEKSLPTIDSELCVYNQKVFVLSCQLEDKYSGSK